jgi:sec-independent protein translocase protein TatA
MLQGFTGWHLLIVLAVILLLFGAAKLPALAKSMGQSARVFRSEIKEMKKDDAVDPPESPVIPSSAEAPGTRNVSNVSADTAREKTDPTP